MQTLTTQHGSYRLSPTRNTGEFLAKLNKCTGKFKPTKAKAERRIYPEFKPGMSTADYVRRYWGVNGLGTPWTEYFPTAEQRAAIETYCICFYFGE